MRRGTVVWVDVSDTSPPEMGKVQHRARNRAVCVDCWANCRTSTSQSSTNAWRHTCDEGPVVSARAGHFFASGFQFRINVIGNPL